MAHTPKKIRKHVCNQCVLGMNGVRSPFSICAERVNWAADNDFVGVMHPDSFVFDFKDMVIPKTVVHTLKELKENGCKSTVTREKTTNVD